MSNSEKIETDSIHETEKSVPRDSERFLDISGPGVGGRPKAHVIFKEYDQYADGTEVVRQLLSFDKPIVNIFAHPGYVNVFLDFGSIHDVDLRVVWDMLSNHRRAENNVSYLPEELESGRYTDATGEHMVYFPVIDLILSPIDRQTEYQLHGFNPAFYTLAPDSLKGEPCVLQLTFQEEWFTVVNDLEPVDYSQLQHEVMEELRSEGHPVDPRL